MTEKNKLIIIGGGIAGLSAGCYTKMNGYDTEIFESHSLPGGLCTSWKRKDYVFDGCIHWLTGSAPGSGFYNIWKQLGAINDNKIINHDEFMKIEGSDGEAFTFYPEIDKLENELKRVAPEDWELIDEIIRVVKLFTGFNPPIEKAPELQGIIDKLKTLRGFMPYAKYFKKYGKISIYDFSKRFNNKLLRENFFRIFGIKEFPAIYVFITLSLLHNRCGGYPLGGSLEFARAIEKKYLELGGKIKYNSRVTKIHVKDDSAVGIRLSDGTDHFADRIISAADGFETIFEFLDGKYLNDKIKGYYKNLPIFQPVIQVSLGVNLDLSDYAHSTTYVFEIPIYLGGINIDAISVNHYCFDPSMAPLGKSSVVVHLRGNYNFWKKLSKDRKHYNEEKSKVASFVIDEIDKHISGFKDAVEAIDVATPMTYKRYTSNWQGSFEGWLPSTDNIGLRMSKTLSGLSEFYMIGQWVEPGGGLPSAAISGRNLVQILCDNDKKAFKCEI